MDRFMFFRERKRLAEEYEKWVNQPLEDGSKIKDCPFSVISFMASKGFVKINDNEVVISKEEYESLTRRRFIITPKQVKRVEVVNLPFVPIHEYEIKPIPSEEEIRRETAEKILDDMFSVIEDKISQAKEKPSLHTGWKCIAYLEVRESLLDLSGKYGVDLEDRKDTPEDSVGEWYE
jgi:hypothetical protein